MVMSRKSSLRDFTENHVGGKKTKKRRENGPEHKCYISELN